MQKKDNFTFTLKFLKNLDFYIFFILILGFAVILRQFIFNRSFFLDEVFLAVNFKNNLSLMLKSLTNSQAAPILFLIIIKSLTIVFSNFDIVLRILPFIFSILSIVFYFLSIRILLEKKIQIISLILFLFSYQLIYFSNYFHHYSSDIFFACLFIYLFVKLNNEGYILKNFIPFFILAILSIWLSFGAIIYLPAIFLTLIIIFIYKKQFRNFRIVLFSSFIWLIDLFIYYYFFLGNKISEMKYVGAVFHESYWPPLIIKNLKDLLWYPRSMISFASYYLGFDGIGKIGFIFSIIFICFFFIGAVYLHKCTHKNRFLLLYLAIAIFTIIVLGFLRKYPIMPRLHSCFVPLFFVIISFGFALISNKLPKLKNFIFIFLIILVAPIIFRGAYHIIEPIYESDVKEIINYYRLEKKYDKNLYVIARNGNLVFNYYVDSALKEKAIFLNGNSINQLNKNNQDFYLILLDMNQSDRNTIVREMEQKGFNKSYSFRHKTIIEKLNFNFLPENIKNYNNPWGEIYYFSFKK